MHNNSLWGYILTIHFIDMRVWIYCSIVEKKDNLQDKIIVFYRPPTPIYYKIDQIFDKIYLIVCLFPNSVER